MPTTSMPWLMASIVTELMTPLIPGAGPPPTTRARRPEFASFAMQLPQMQAGAIFPFEQCTAKRHPCHDGFWFPGSAWEPGAGEALPREAEPRVHGVPRQSLGTRVIGDTSEGGGRAS